MATQWIPKQEYIYIGECGHSTTEEGHRSRIWVQIRKTDLGRLGAVELVAGRIGFAYVVVNRGVGLSG
jgi:hypothetical protein